MEERYEKDGKIGVLVSRGYGAGWSTWADEEHKEFMTFNPQMIHALLADDRSEVDRLARARGCYTGGINKLEVEWVGKGVQFRIEEYDGAEILLSFHAFKWLTA